MFVAQKLRNESIAEYLLYMWQVEDIIRAYGCNLQAIRDQYISRFNYPQDKLDDETDWFGNLVTMMNREGKRQGGHLQINQVVLSDLNELHQRLLKSGRFPLYNSEYYKVLPFIVELRQKGDRDVSEIETCLNALYGVMLLRLQQKPISPETQHAIKEITTFIGMLSDYYKQDKTEGLDFGDDE